MYAHLKKIYVKEKQEIKQKQKIALSGNTGTTTGPHLHYSIWYEGELIDPMGCVDLPYTDDVKSEYAQRGEGIT